MIALVVENTKANHDHNRIFDFVSINRTSRHTGFRNLMIHHAKNTYVKLSAVGADGGAPAAPSVLALASTPPGRKYKCRQSLSLIDSTLLGGGSPWSTDFSPSSSGPDLHSISFPDHF
jgi:hypothetical protein